MPDPNITIIVQNTTLISLCRSISPDIKNSCPCNITLIVKSKMYAWYDCNYTLCCQWYEQVGDISISADWHQYIHLRIIINNILATERSMGKNAFHMVFHSSPIPAFAATRLWAGYGELVRQNCISWKTMWNAYHPTGSQYSYYTINIVFCLFAIHITI